MFTGIPIIISMATPSVYAHCSRRNAILEEEYPHDPQEHHKLTQGGIGPTSLLFSKKSPCNTVNVEICKSIGQHNISNQMVDFVGAIIMS